MRILFATGSSPRYMAPPRLSAEQINCGPNWHDRDIAGYVVSRSTPRGRYDIGSVLARLPSDQMPDTLVCLVDAAFRSMPANLAAFRGPKVLLVADTHHLDAPLRKMIQYARSEPYDRIVLLYDRHHASVFADAGFKSLYWYPGLTFPHDDATVRAARHTERDPVVAFVGSLGICHPRRIQLLSHLNAQGLPVRTAAVSQAEGLSLYGKSEVGFNASLNGDLNVRTFEILSAGAVLLTDALAPASGMSELWRNGEEVLTYGNQHELAEMARRALQDRAWARRIGDAGARWFDTHFNVVSRRMAFERLVSDGTAPDLFPLERPSPSVVPPAPSSLVGWVEAYEHVQELHRNLARVTVVVDPSTPKYFEALCRTLPRVEVVEQTPPAGTQIDFLIVDRERLSSTTLAIARSACCWNALPADRPALLRRMAAVGLTTVGDGNVFMRRQISTHSDPGAIACALMEQGRVTEALDRAKQAMTRNAASVDAHLVLLEIAQELGRDEIAARMTKELQVLAPHHPRFVELRAAGPKEIRRRRKMRVLRVAQAACEQREWKAAEAALSDAMQHDTGEPDVLRVRAQVFSATGRYDQAFAAYEYATFSAPDSAELWREYGLSALARSRWPRALGALLMAQELEPAGLETSWALAVAAHALRADDIAVSAANRLTKLEPDLARLERLGGFTTNAAPVATIECDLLVTHVEVNRLHGTGVLLQRCFPESRGFVTLRSCTRYAGEVQFDGTHLEFSMPGLPERHRRTVLQTLLRGYRVRRILAVPFFATDFSNALIAHEITGAPLCTYVMDDQTVHARGVPAELARRLFLASDLRLAISPEMASCYSKRFGTDFGLLPPFVSDTKAAVANRWTKSVRSASHAAVVGNIWSAAQLQQLGSFLRAAKITVDWFGNANVPWLPRGKEELRAQRIDPQGFLPEDQLARRLSQYPFVIVPSGALDGTETNEWLTRLSIPSRIVFIVTHTQTPILVLGNPVTATARFVERFGLGVCSNYDALEAEKKIAALTDPAMRDRWLEAARSVSASFIMPDCGKWIWESLAARRALPTPFGALFAGSDPSAVVPAHQDACS